MRPQLALVVAFFVGVATVCVANHNRANTVASADDADDFDEAQNAYYLASPITPRRLQVPVDDSRVETPHGHRVVAVE